LPSPGGKFQRLNHIRQRCMKNPSNIFRRGLFLAVVFFVLTRALALASFPIFNDEAIYLQYTQLIHDDWSKNRFISMNGEYGDWKPPLQYWLTAPIIRLGHDPLIAGRLVSVCISFFGLFGTYLFARELFGRKEASLAALAYALCPTVLFHNDQFTAETFLFSTTPFLYCSILKMTGSGRNRFLWVLPAVGLGSILLLVKQSGAQLLLVSLALSFARFRSTNGQSESGRTEGPVWRELIRNVTLIGIVILGSYLVARLVIPAQFNETRRNFDRQWVLSFAEILQPPWPTWRANFRLAGEYVGAYYSWGVMAMFCVYLWFAIRRKDIAELALAAMCLTGAGTIIFLLRGFNEYLLNTSIIVVLLPLLGRAIVMMWSVESGDKRRLVRSACLLLTCAILVFWIYQALLICFSPGRYIERSTKWAVSNYLKSWSTGFGVDEVVEMLAKETEPGVIITNTQWGNPTTALELYAKDRFPQLRIVGISSTLLDPAHIVRLKEMANKIGPAHYVIGSGDRSERYEPWIGQVERELCITRTEVRADPNQTPIVVCRF
jgi:hypothetical protein